MGLKNRAVPLRDVLQREYQFVRGIVHAAERRAHREPPLVLAGIFLEELLRLGNAAGGVLDHALRHEPRDRLVLVEAAHREHHAHARAHDGAHSRIGMIVPRLDVAGDPVAQHLYGREHDAGVNVVFPHRRLVGVHVLEQERLRVRFVRQAARELERGVQVIVDQPGCCHRALAVDDPVRAPCLLDRRSLADRCEFPVLHDDRSVADDTAIRVDGDQPVDVPHQKIRLIWCAHAISSKRANRTTSP
ncbi:MAG: hypothetical protein A3G24_19040 [Betaproteobacteria bacterium RIFCSPLOWO2_12_FULL_62_13]|nr:MAG: hypothetical protein A3G24_19040 [Betaproteobacteria bacterium RIFCSPLOWO2_12_FULL_62_13]